MYGIPTDNVTLVATAMEELTSRSLASDVADSLGLRLQLVAPARPLQVCYQPRPQVPVLGGQVGPPTVQGQQMQVGVDHGCVPHHSCAS